jgi:hypothetical protein
MPIRPKAPPNLEISPPEETSMNRPTAAQRKVLEAMRDGAVVSGDPPLVKMRNGMAWRVKPATVAVLKKAGWITLGGTLGRSWYEITDLGRAALRRE